jgi:hypothetical protein
MVCIFCRSNSHNKSNCTNENVIRIQSSYIYRINELIEIACRRRIQHVEFETELKIWLRSHTVLNLKMIIEHYKNITHVNYGRCSTKDEIIPIILIYVISQNYNLLQMNLISSGSSSTIRHPSHHQIGLNVQVPFRDPPVIYRSLPPPPPPPQPQPTVMQTQFKSYKFKVYKFDETCNENDDCPICYESLINDSFVKLNCSHYFCKFCVKKCIISSNLKCPLCRVDITEIYTQNPKVYLYI